MSGDGDTEMSDVGASTAPTSAPAAASSSSSHLPSESISTTDVKMTDATASSSPTTNPAEDDDALIAAALAEEEEDEETGDEEEEEDQSSQLGRPSFLASAAASNTSATPAPSATADLPPGATYISETGEMKKKRAPRKKKVVEVSAADVAMAEEQKKELQRRAQELLDSLLKRTNEIMLRTQEGSGQLAQPTSAATRKKKKGDGAPRRKSEKEEDSELLDDLDDEKAANGAMQLRVQPPNVQGTMREYQLAGLNWMIRLYHAGVSGILADEMGLGKTLQSISLLAYLRHFQKLPGPHLVLVPLTTLGNWSREFERWAPSIRCFKFHGTKEERQQMIADGMLKEENWDVLLTSYEMSIREKSSLAKVKWNFIIVDEAHRLKNEDSLLSQIVRLFSSRNRLLLTGTPLQNNLHELWALLNFLLPDIFSSGADFDSMFSASEMDADVSAKLLEQLQKVLRPFMLRRLKAQVATDLPPKKETLLFVGMSELQTKLYKGVLERDIDAVLGKTKEKGRLMNIIMQLRKCSNHPYLFEGVEDRNLPPYGDHLITNSGKMVVLDKLLERFQKQGSRVLIFSQMTRTLDILEDYCVGKQYQYCRIDGSTSQEDREVHMKDFNADESQKFLFLLSTRAGGLGINLNTADIVILYDSDWNPQMDLQAMDRAHRLGQKKKVFVYRLVTENTIEEKIIERAEIKLRLDAMVIQQGRTGPKANAKPGAGGMSADEVSSMIRFGADRIFRQKGSTVTEADIDAILLAGEQRTQELNSKLGKHIGLLDLNFDAPLPPDETNMDELEKHMLLNLGDSMGKRDRKKMTYDVNATFRDQMRENGQVVKTHLPKPYKLPRMPDYQLWQAKRVTELCDKERAWYEKHATDPTAPATRGGLTEAEDKELQRLLAAGFADWQWSDYIAFIAACKRYGGKMSDIDKIVKAMDGRSSKTRDEIIKYHIAFFEHAPHHPGFKSSLDKIARGEARAKKFAELEDLLESLLSAYPQRTDVMERLPIHHAPLMKGRGFSLHEDRFLLYWCRILGYGEWTKLRAQIRRDSEFRFDYFLKSRSCIEISRRVDALLRSMKKEASKQQTKKKSGPVASIAAAASSSADHGTPPLKPQTHSSRGVPGGGDIWSTNLVTGRTSTRLPSPSPSPLMFQNTRDPNNPLAHQPIPTRGTTGGPGATAATSSHAAENGSMGVNDDAPLIKRRGVLKFDEFTTNGASMMDVDGLDDPHEDIPLAVRKRQLLAVRGQSAVGPQEEQ